MAANGFTALILYFFWLAARLEKNGLDGFDAGFVPALLALLALGFFISGVLILYQRI